MAKKKLSRAQHIAILKAQAARRNSDVYLREYEGEMHILENTHTGDWLLDGKACESPSSAAKILTGQQKKGRKFWGIEGESQICMTGTVTLPKTIKKSNKQELQALRKTALEWIEFGQRVLELIDAQA